MATGQYNITSSKAAMGRAYPFDPSVRRKEKKALMKLSLKQRIRSWLLDSGDETEVGQDICVQEDKLSSDGMRMQIYKANGGFVVETRGYDRQKDRHLNSMHVITQDQDLGDALGKIVMMEALRG
jgi:hypothetical protein